ncbi:MAG: hypothetical protein ACJ79L_05490 [Anaeromyxobacteraceae bacterium]
MADRRIAYLGDLETAVMEHVWTHGALTVGSPHGVIEGGRPSPQAATETSSNAVSSR